MQDLTQFEEITDLDFSAEGSHLAVCHKMQGGSANGVHHMLLAKSGEELDDVQILSSVRVLKSLDQEVPVELIEKAGMSYSNIKNMLHDVIVDTYGDDIWIADFTDKVVVFMDEGVYYAQPYRHRRGEYHLIEDRANVIRCEYFSLDPNNKVSDETKKLIEAGSQIVVNKSDEGILAEVFESIFDTEDTLTEIADEVNKAKEDIKKEDLEDEEHRGDVEDNDLDVESEEDIEKVKGYVNAHKVYKRDDVTKEGDTPKKTFNGVKRPASDFAYTPDNDKPSTWKLPIYDKEHARLAEQALTSNIMGNKVKIPSEDLGAVKRKVAAANKKFKNDIKKATSEIGVVDNKNPETGVNNVEVQNQDITKSADFIALEKAMKAMQEEIAIQKSQLDAEKAQNSILKAKEDARVAVAFTNVVKSAGFLDEDASPAVVDFLCKASDESAELLVSILEKAKAKIAEVEAEKDVIKSNFGSEVGISGTIRTEDEINKADNTCLSSFKDLITETYGK